MSPGGEQCTKRVHARGFFQVEFKGLTFCPELKHWTPLDNADAFSGAHDAVGVHDLTYLGDWKVGPAQSVRDEDRLPADTVLLDAFCAAQIGGRI